MTCNRSTTYVASNNRDNVVLLIGKRGSNAVLTIVLRNGGANYAIALGHATAVQAVEDSTKLSFSLDSYCDCRLISVLSGTTYSAVTE